MFDSVYWMKASRRIKLVTDVFRGRIMVIVAEMEPGAVKLVDGDADMSVGANDGASENEDILFDSLILRSSISILTAAEPGVDHPLVATIGSKIQMKTNRCNIGGNVTPRKSVLVTRTMTTRQK